ncbi:hypothetical protein [Latilactobacillus graminis]|uniref:Uncharacterized protein n=2 Tax=Latilactobacillus graminis TaxID=60519 RepID=A0AA89I023_9LACO|nr:hypothetical protein [Latilactobacillus graminis]KRM21199.1 hypothetical protein FC90_GL001736 [Latilactobacillus graminis DSM 20719]QFP79325.1 hypothetical protein LG542_03365 [Latilactobacillus graminis]
MKEPKIIAAQLISNREVYQMFNTVKKKVKKNPVFIMDKGKMDIVIISYADLVLVLNGELDKFELV